MVYIYLFFVLFCIIIYLFSFVPIYDIYVYQCFSDFYSFNYHNYGHPTSLAF